MSHKIDPNSYCFKCKKPYCNDCGCCITPSCSGCNTQPGLVSCPAVAAWLNVNQQLPPLNSGSVTYFTSTDNIAQPDPREYVNTLSQSERQALYMFLHDAHGCRRW